MAFADRLPLIKKLEELRGSKVICYVTSLRPNVAAQMADDAVRVFFDHLLSLPERKIEKLDVFLCSNGVTGWACHPRLPFCRHRRQNVGNVNCLDDVETIAGRRSEFSHVPGLSLEDSEHRDQHDARHGRSEIMVIM